MHIQSTANVVIPFYSSYGPTQKWAAAEGAGSTGRLRGIPEILSAEEAMAGQDACEGAQADMADLPRIGRGEFCRAGA